MDIKKLIEDEFSGNFGLLSESNQEKLLNSRMAVAGAGGVGGLQFDMLKRKYRYSRLWRGDKNPLHRLKNTIILGKIKKQIREGN